MAKRLFFSLILSLSIATALADDYKSLVFQSPDGTTASVDLASLVLTVTNGRLTATNSTGTQSFTLSNLSKMYFSKAETTGIEGVIDSDANGVVAVYDVSGRKVGDYRTLDSAKSSLKQGMYIVKVNGKTFKIAVK